MVGLKGIIRFASQILNEPNGIVKGFFCLLCIVHLQGCTSDKEIYQVQQIAPVINLDDIEWTQGNLLTDFISPWQDAATGTSFRSVWDGDYFYFRFDVKEPNVLVYRENDHELEVVRSERVEIFFRQNEQLDPYYCLEMDASGRVHDYQAVYYRKFDPDWSWPEGQLEVKALNTTNGYVVIGKISLKSLEQLGLLKDRRMQAGLFRGRRTSQNKSASDNDFHWVSWIDPKTDQPDFHVASSFGVLELVE